MVGWDEGDEGGDWVYKEEYSVFMRVSILGDWFGLPIFKGAGLGV